MKFCSGFVYILQYYFQKSLHNGRYGTNNHDVLYKSISKLADVFGVLLMSTTVYSKGCG